MYKRQQYVYGRDVNGRVSGGEQIIEGGGSAENAVVSENGIQQVGFYGTSENTRVDAGGVQLSLIHIFMPISSGRKLSAGCRVLRRPSLYLR